MDKRLDGAIITIQEDYQPGDQPPEGYLAWHEWADVQFKAGIKQVECGSCGLWKTPQELSEEFVVTRCVKSGRELKQPFCNKCKSI